MGGPALRVLSTLGVMGVVEALRAALEAGAGMPLAVRFAPTAVLLDEIRDGAAADAAILTAEAVAALSGTGRLDPGSRVDLARSFVGVAVRAGAPHPDLGSAADFARLLRGARSVAVSRAGASGIFLAGLVERLGLAGELAAKAVVIPSGLTGEVVARGEAEVAIQQVSELMAVPGVEVVGRLPAELGGEVTFAGGVFRDSPRAEAARRLLGLLADAGRAGTYRDRGLEPVAAAR